MKKNENIYTSHYIQSLEEVYCHSRSAVTSVGLSCSSANLPTRIINGGKKAIYTATMTAMLLNNMALQAIGKNITVSSGVISSNLSARTRDNINVYGNTISTLIGKNGTENVYSGGITTKTIVGRLGHQVIFNAGTANSTILYVQGKQTVLSGGTASNTSVLTHSARQNVYGTANNTVISQADQYIYNGGIANGVSIIGWIGESSMVGSQVIFNGGTANNVEVNGGATQYVFSGGIVNNTTLNGAGSSQNGAYQYLSDGALAYNTIINSTGYQYILGGQAFGTTINNRGWQTIYKKGRAINTTVNGGRQNITFYGIAENTVINSGGRQVIKHASAIASDTTINNSGLQNVKNGSSVNATITSGGIQNIVIAGKASNTTINMGGLQNISSGGLAERTIVNYCGHQRICNGAVASTNIINGVVIANSNYSSTGKTIIMGHQEISSGGIAINTFITNGDQEIFGAIAKNTILYTHGWQSVWNGGSAIDTTINQGGQQFITMDAFASKTIVNSGGLQYTEGQIINTTINNGGRQYVKYYGVASNTVVNSGGAQIFSYGGCSSIDVIQYSGGNINVFVANEEYELYPYINGINQNGETFSLSSGVASNFIINSGGWQIVSSGGIANNTTINGGGIQTIYNGGQAKNTVANNATINLYANGTINGLNASGGLVNIYANNHLSGNISLDQALLNINSSGSMKTVQIDNLTANNAVVSMSVDLPQNTGDSINILSSYNGNTTLNLTNIATQAAATTDDGIKLIDLDDNATDNGTFELAGGKWDQGGYSYKLLQGTINNIGNDYYLRSVDYSDVFKTIADLPLANIAIAKTGVNSLQRRMGDLRDMNSKDKKQGIWARGYYKNITVEDLAKTDMRLFGGEAGYDWLFRADEPTKLYAGVMFGFIDANDIKTEKVNNTQITGKGSSPSVGLYATLINDNNWFIDIAARNFWTKLDITNYTDGGQTLKLSPERNIIAGSIEIGKAYNRELDSGSVFKWEPKVEIGYMNAAQTTTAVENGATPAEYAAANYLNAKAAVLFGYKVEMANKLLIEPVLELGYTQEFLGKNEVSYGNATREGSMKGGSFEVLAGLNMQLADNLYWHALGTYEAGNKLSGWGVNAGIRLGFGGKVTQSKKKTNYNYRNISYTGNKTASKVKQTATKMKATSTKTKATSTKTKATSTKAKTNAQKAQSNNTKAKQTAAKRKGRDYS